MFTKTISSTLIAGAIALGTLTTLSTPADAKKLRFSINGGGFDVRIGKRIRVSSGKCSSNRALRKARNRGLTDVYVLSISKKRVIIEGVRWGAVTYQMGFGRRSRNCPVKYMREV